MGVTVPPHEKGVVSPQLTKQFASDGVVHVPGALDREWVRLIAEGIERNRRLPSHHARTLYPGTEREMYLDYCNHETIPEYRVLLADSPVADIVADVLSAAELYLYFDQIWIKDAGIARRTPWHQDLTVWLTSPGKLCGCWITIDPVPQRESLEFVRGSHRGPLYDMSRLDGDPSDDTAMLYGNMPRLPDIEAERDRHDIVSYANEPGDIVLFHPGVLHGGGASTVPRRTLSLRFYGEDVTYNPPAGDPSPAFPGVAATHRPGDPLRSTWFPRVR